MRLNDCLFGSESWFPIFINLCISCLYGFGRFGSFWLLTFLRGVRASFWIAVVAGRSLRLDWLPRLLSTIQSGSTEMPNRGSAFLVQPFRPLLLLNIRVVMPDG